MNEKVDKFWNWFANNYQRLGDNFENKALVAQLDEKVSELGDLSWELGPGEDKKNAFVISPNGNYEMLELSKAIIEKAPEIEGWEFHYAKPPKKWELKFNYGNLSGGQLDIDASSWDYVLLA